MGNLYSYDDCEFSDRCCCFVWDLEKTESNESFNTVRLLPALCGKSDFMKLLVNYGYVSSLPDESPLLLDETQTHIHYILWTVTGRYFSIDDTGAVMKLAIDTFFRCKGRESYKRVFLAAVAIKAITHSLKNQCQLAKDYISCLNMYFSATRDNFLTVFEVRSVLYTCLSFANKLDLFDIYSEVFDELMPECPAKTEPRKLIELTRCQIRENLNVCKLPLPEAIEQLHLPNILKSFVLGDVFDISRKTGNASAQNAVSKSELDEMFLKQSKS